MSRTAWRATALVAAVYVYFLIFAEFAFIELARPVTGDGARLRGVMGALGAGGVAGSLLGAMLFGRADWGRRLARWLVACAAAAGLALWAPRGGVAGLVLAGAAVGLALGGATVCLAAGLRAAAGGGRLGRVAGLGTGAAYALCNLPPVFEAGAGVQTGLAALVALAGTGLARGAGADEGKDARVGPAAAGAWTLVFLALVWMDSAAFYIIQHTEALRSATWSGGWTLWGNAATHLGAAVLAGAALDRRREGALALAAAVLLAAACHWITDTGGELLYVAGVSLYSTALVFVAARPGRAGVAALIFSVAGWGGSALGIGMAQDLHGIPGWFAPAALGVVAGGLVWRRRREATLRAVVVGMAALVPGESRADGAAVARGREVYVAEGCIHCHSQYVRLGTSDVLRWGPARPLEELLKERPPLFGNRRQGPDLLNVGNRRTAEWNRLHLIEPRVLSPGSRMPSYARLFVAGERRGEDLVAYLASLGAGTEEKRAAEVAAWRTVAEARAGGRSGAGAGAEAEMFARLCAQCHGPGGHGDGPLAARLGGGVPDLTRAAMDRDEERLARLIKFGRPGTAMAGHESLADEHVVSLARFVAGLNTAGTTR